MNSNLTVNPSESRSKVKYQPQSGAFAVTAIMSVRRRCPKDIISQYLTIGAILHRLKQGVVSTKVFGQKIKSEAPELLR